MTSTHTPQHETIAAWFKAFYAVSDDGTAHEAYPSFFAEDAKLIMGDKVAVGRQGMTPHSRYYSAPNSQMHPGPSLLAFFTTVNPVTYLYF